MNAFLAKKAILLAAPLFGLAAGGCIGAFDPATDPTSPLAPRVQALVDANRDYPRWEDFPAAPVDLPQPAQVAASVGALRTSSQELAREVSLIDWTLTEDPEAFAESIRRRIDATLVSPISARTAEEIEAFAAELRRRGAAPPPIDRRP